MKVREYELDVNIQEELNNFEWENEQVRGDKFQACSPFRNEKRPSFAVNLETGTWKDSGAIDMKLLKGNLISLIAILRGETYEQVEDYLIEKYATVLADTDSLCLNINLNNEKAKPKYIDIKNLKHLYVEKTDYLTNRGISLEVQKMFGTGYSPDTKSIALLWTDLQGRIINIKYRRIDSKSFYYESGGQPIKNFVYGLYQCKVRQAKRVFICESETDALYLWSNGCPAIAVGGASLSDKQKLLILKAGIEELVIATDNDAVGHRFRQFLKEEFAGLLRVYDVEFPANKKDINDLDCQQVAYVISTTRPISFSFLKM